MIFTDIKKRINTSIVLFLLIFLIYSFPMMLVYSLIILGVYSILEFLNISKKIFKNKFNLILFNLFFIIFISIYCIMFFFFSNFLQFKIILFILLLGCVASDIGGFTFGKLFKGPRLTKISPNKTIFGAIGSIIFTILVVSGLFFYSTMIFEYKILIIALITSVACQLGDLFFSFLKRIAKLKDTGNILPGHGGILDRLDGIFFGIPLGFIALIILY
jgi:phosphatidate cytidylyltransferase